MECSQIAPGACDWDWVIVIVIFRHVTINEPEQPWQRDEGHLQLLVGLKSSGKQANDPEKGGTVLPEMLIV